MKSPKNYEFPSLPRFVIYIALIAGFCFLNCLTLEARVRTENPVTKGNYGIMNAKLSVAEFSLPQFLFEVYLKVVLQEINEQPSDNDSGYLVEIATENEFSNFRTLTTGTTIVFPTFGKSSD
jgi:hypothetical protein